MNPTKTGLRIAGTIFGFVALLHLLRLLTGISVMIGEFLLPLWVNVMGLIATTILCIGLWVLSGRKAE